MPRPCKRRRICQEPVCRRFGPTHGELPPSMSIAMTLDEYETIRLIDLDGLTQEQCAVQMDIARTTVQAIYAAAREKLARCVVTGAELIIGGGEVTLCPGGLCGSRCKKRCQRIPASPDNREEHHDENCGHL